MGVRPIVQKKRVVFCRILVDLASHLSRTQRSHTHTGDAQTPPIYGIRWKAVSGADPPDGTWQVGRVELTPYSIMECKKASVPNRRGAHFKVTLIFVLVIRIVLFCSIFTAKSDHFLRVLCIILIILSRARAPGQSFAAPAPSARRGQKIGSAKVVQKPFKTISKQPLCQVSPLRWQLDDRRRAELICVLNDG